MSRRAIGSWEAWTRWWERQPAGTHVADTFKAFDAGWTGGGDEAEARLASRSIAVRLIARALNLTGK